MNKDWMRDVMEDVRMQEEKRSELWAEMTKKADHRKHVRKRVAAAVAVFILLAVPAGVYASSGFKWAWGNFGQKNQQLNTQFKEEHGSAEANGYRFCVEQAFCDESLKVAYYYVSVTDISGKNRDPHDYESRNFDLNVGDLTYEFQVRDMECSTIVYDKENSTKQKAYYYLESNMSADANSGELGKIDINFSKVGKKSENPKEGTKTMSMAKADGDGDKTIEIKNVLQMPSLTWNINAKVEVKVSSIAARIAGAKNPKFEIVRKDGTEIKDFEDWHDGAEERTSKYFFDSEKSRLYRFNYVDIDEISGVRVDGEFYSAEDAAEQK